MLPRNVGCKVRLVPAACHLDGDGDLLPPRGEDWTITAHIADSLVIKTDSGQSYRLGEDNIFSFASDADRSEAMQKYGFLTLKVQLFIQGNTVSAMPNLRPGEPVDPPTVSKTARARSHFAPELERLFRRQVHVLERCLLNYGLTSHDKPSNPPDTWESLRPKRSRLYPNAAPVHDLSPADVRLLAEFYGALDEVDEIIEDWMRKNTAYEYNCWNLLMHKVEQSLRMGGSAIRKFCCDRQYDATMPASGTLLSRSATCLTHAKDARADCFNRFEAKLLQQQQLKQRHTALAARGLRVMSETPQRKNGRVWI
jgi:hypothetical protein